MPVTILWDRTYEGPRWTYGLTYRPLLYGNAPDDWITLSWRESRTFRFGTVDYPRQLSDDELGVYELTELMADLTNEERDEVSLVLIYAISGLRRRKMLLQEEDPADEEIDDLNKRISVLESAREKIKRA